MLAALCTTAFAAGTPDKREGAVSVTSIFNGKCTQSYANGEYSYVYKEGKPGFYIFTWGKDVVNYNPADGTGKWIKTTFVLTPTVDLKNVTVSPLINDWNYMSDEKSLGGLSAGKEYLIDAIFDRENAKMYLYKNGECITNGDTYINTSLQQNGNCIYVMSDNSGLVADEEFIKLKNVSVIYYSNDQTLADFEAEEKEIRDNIEKETKVDKQTFSTVPSNGKKLDDGSYESTYTNPYNATTNPERDTFSLGESVKFDQSDAVVKTSFVRWHMDAEVKTYEGGVIEIEPVKNAKSFGRIVISADSKKHSIDILYDISAKKSYLYVDNAFAASGDLPDVESIGSVILKVTMPKDKKMVVDYSNVYYELYYDNPTEHKLEDIQKTIDTGSVTVTGVCVYNSGENKLAIWVGYAGVDTDKYNGYIAEYDANGMLVDARELGPWVDINSKTENAKVFIWEKSTNKPIISAVSSMKCDNEVVK